MIKGGKKSDVYPSISSALGRSVRKKKHPYIPTLLKQRQQTSPCSLNSSHLYKINGINAFQLVLELFEVRVLLKGKCADFAQKSHLPRYGEGCSVCEKELPVRSLYLWARLVRLDQTSTDDVISKWTDIYCKSPGQLIELTI